MFSNTPLLNAFSKGFKSILDKSKQDLEAPTPKEALRYFTWLKQKRSRLLSDNNKHIAKHVKALIAQI